MNRIDRIKAMEEKLDRAAAAIEAFMKEHF